MTQSRRRHPGRLLIGVASACLLGLSACGSTAPAVERRGEAAPVTLGTMTASDVGAAQQSFGLDLLHAVCMQRPGENLLLSPTSAAEALALLYPAAAGSTSDELGALLHLPAWSPDLVAAMAAHTRALTDLAQDGPTEGPDAPDSLRMSNRIWADLGVEPEQQYLDDVATALDAGLQSVDFAGDPRSATDSINDAVRRDTDGLIDGLFDEPLSPSTVTVLTNALHLRAFWSEPFTDTIEMPFTTPAGPATVPMMTGAAGEGRSAEGWVSVTLPYRAGTMAATALLPPAGTDPCAVDDGVLVALAAAAPAEVAVAMPRVRIEQTHDLLDILRDLGLPADGDYARLGVEGLSISAVVQKVVLEVDEDGTVAAAATGVGVAGSAPVERELVVLDRPYLLLLTDTATGSPLFTAVVTDPSA